MVRFDFLFMRRLAMVGVLPPLAFTAALFVFSGVFGFFEASFVHYVVIIPATSFAGIFAYIVITRHLRLTFTLAETIADTSHDGIVITDRKNRIVYANPTVVRSTGYKRAELVGMTPGDFKSGIHDKAYYERMWRSIHEQGHWRGEIWDRRKNGDLLPKDLTIRTVKDRRGNIRYHLGIHRDLTEIETLKKDKEMLLRTHPETGLPNELALRERMEELLERSVPFHLLLTKVNNKSALMASRDEKTYLGMFKPLSDALRKEERVTLYAQIDSEFFALLVYRGTQEEETFASYLRGYEKRLQEMADHLGTPLDCTSALVAHPEHGEETDDLTTAAHVTLAAAIEAGTSGMVFTASLQEELEGAQRLVEALRNAVENEEIAVAYQPIVALDEGKIAGFEALARFQGHSPAVFIPLAERHGLIGEVGRLVRRQAFAAKKVFDGIHDESYLLTLNISVQEFANDTFLPEITRQCEETGVSPKDIVLEITESTYVSNYAAFNDFLRALKKEGFRIAVDDFGTGYSSLSHLQEMPVDMLKIDRSFVADLPATRSLGVIEAIIALGKAHELDIIAEGIEHADQAEIIKRLGGMFAQGFLFAKPLAEEEMTKALQKKNGPFNGRSGV